MTGILLAVVLTLFACLALGGALFAYSRREKREDAQPKRKRRELEFVTREELEEAIAEATKELTFEWNEWYEKFDKLHLRLAKRAKRAEKQEEVDQEELGFDAGERPSVLSFRRLGSV